DQAAPVLSPGCLVTRRARPPPEDTIHRSGLPRRYEVNATSPPVGEYAGSRQSDPILVITDVRPPSMSTTAISRDPRPFSAKAMREPNTPRWLVNHCTTSLANSWTASRTSAALYVLASTAASPRAVT